MTRNIAVMRCCLAEDRNGGERTTQLARGTRAFCEPCCQFPDEWMSSLDDARVHSDRREASLVMQAWKVIPHELPPCIRSRFGSSSFSSSNNASFVFFLI